jgi:hypothetical protein
MPLVVCARGCGARSRRVVHVELQTLLALPLVVVDEHEDDVGARHVLRGDHQVNRTLRGSGRGEAHTCRGSDTQSREAQVSAVDERDRSRAWCHAHVRVDSCVWSSRVRCAVRTTASGGISTISSRSFMRSGALLSKKYVRGTCTRREASREGDKKDESTISIRRASSCRACIASLRVRRMRMRVCARASPCTRSRSRTPFSLPARTAD